MRENTAKNLLPSWNEGTTKQRLVKFIEDTAREGASSFVPPAERIIVLDNDGTLWCERPLYFQYLFIFDRVRALASEHPEWKKQRPFKAIIENDTKILAKLTQRDIIEITLAVYAGITTTEFEHVVKDWLACAKHPRFNRAYTECVYQPMLELLAFLRANGFKIWIVSGGGIEFMRVWTNKVYGIPPENIVGSTIKTKFEIRNGQPILMRLPEVDFIDDKDGKPVTINKFIGRRPIATFGNSDGDLQMLQWTAAGDGERLMVLIHHTDDEREYAYDKGSPVGGLNKALDEAEKNNWTVVDMKKDWKYVFPFEER